MEHSEDIKDLAAAMVEAQGEIGNAAKDATNPHFRTRYADLASIMDACKGALNRHGIAVLQAPAPSEQGSLAIDTVLMHKSGQWASGRMVIPLQKIDPQGYGSALTYARRYALASMVGVCPEDDDGEGAMNRSSNGNARQQPQRQQANGKPANGRGTDHKADVNADEAFEIQVGEALEARGFDRAGWDRMKVAVCQKKKVALLRQLSPSDRKALLAAIENGDMDKFKEAPKAREAVTV